MTPVPCRVCGEFPEITSNYDVDDEGYTANEWWTARCKNDCESGFVTTTFYDEIEAAWNAAQKEPDNGKP